MARTPKNKPLNSTKQNKQTNKQTNKQNHSHIAVSEIHNLIKTPKVLLVQSKFRKDPLSVQWIYAWTQAYTGAMRFSSFLRTAKNKVDLLGPRAALGAGGHSLGKKQNKTKQNKKLKVVSRHRSQITSSTTAKTTTDSNNLHSNDRYAPNRNHTCGQQSLQERRLSGTLSRNDHQKGLREAKLSTHRLLTAEPF